MANIGEAFSARLLAVAALLVDQRRARVLVGPQQNAAGYWFGAGNMVLDRNGSLWLCGRYRNAGDSRTGTRGGTRGLELALFRSHDQWQTQEKVLDFSKSELDVGQCEVLSIEGCALHLGDAGAELYVSTEKTNLGYPAGWSDYSKPGTGVWTIDHLHAAAPDALKTASVRTLLSSKDPQFMHFKDPVLYDTADGDEILLFCTHPFGWTSSNAAFTMRRRGAQQFDSPRFDFFPRGVTWDVAISRSTCVVRLPSCGVLSDRVVSLMFYDGGESIRRHEEHEQAVRRPRGYSCEEIGGCAYIMDDNFAHIQRLSIYEPMFVSPTGTGCSRYVDVLPTPEGYYVTWQQSQSDGSQPLVLNFVAADEVARLLE